MPACVSVAEEMVQKSTTRSAFEQSYGIISANQSFWTEDKPASECKVEKIRYASN